MASRKFNFSLSALIGAARRLHDALVDPDYGTAMAARLDAPADTATSNFTTRFAANLAALDTGDATQKLKTGHAGTLTTGQNAAFDEMERLLAGARRSAKLAFPTDSVKLHSDFQVGISEPNTLEAELSRAKIVLASCQEPRQRRRAENQGWLAADTTALDAAIEELSGVSLDQDEALEDRKGLTASKNVAANAVYADTLRIQNAARLEYPANKPGAEAARARFLLDTYPPRDRSDPAGGTQTPSPPSAPPTSTP